MCYRFQNSADIRSEILRIAREQIAQALTELSSKIPQEEKVHNVRRCLKRLRSLLKFIRPYVPSDFYEAEHKHFRDLGRGLATVRDLSVMLQRFDELKLPHSLRDPLAKVAAGGQLGTKEIGKTRKGLQQALKRVENWPVACLNRQKLCEGLASVYKNARKAFKKARKEPLTTKIHHWRQRAKVLEHSYRLIEPFCPKSLQKKAKKSDKLSDLLGEYHDLAVLAQNLKKIDPAIALRRTALDKVSARSRKLEERAFKMGLKVFDRSPRAFFRKYQTILTSRKVTP